MSILQHAPRLDPREAAEVARAVFGIEATATPLASERDQNFTLASRTGRFVLKIANRLESRDLLDAQNAAMAHAAARGARCPAVLAATTGETIAEIESGGERYFARALTWIEGLPLGRLRHHPETLLEDLGAGLGELDAALATFDHPAAHREFHWDLARAFETIERQAGAMRDAVVRAMVERGTDAIGRRIGGAMGSLRRAVIHGDANDHNVLAGSDADAPWGHHRVAGFIDFGDMVHSVVVADLAIAIAYGVLDKADPLAAAARITRGYHRHFRLEPNEIAVLWDLVQLRLLLSVALAAAQLQERPGDAYLAISQAPILRTLPILAAVAPALAHASLRHACDVDPCPRASRVVAWLASRQPAPVVRLPVHGTQVLDLSIGSALVAGDGADNAEPRLTRRIDDQLGDAAAGRPVGVGRYGEPRLLYSSPLFAAGGPHAARRTVHLGIDLFAPPGTPVSAPFDGVVHAAADNRAALDYGPVVILSHETDGGDRFFTLYGHLTRESLHGLEPGRHVTAGEPLAAIGPAGVNGGWTPHLHFQLIVELAGLGTDFPGVCAASHREAWQALTPDPNAILRLDGASYPASDLDVAAAVRRRRSVIGPSVRAGYHSPLKIVRGWMQYLYDANGRQYLDAYNNVPHVGHAHPRVTAAVAAQSRVLNTNTRYLHDALAALAERVASTLPAPLRVCYFVNSGSEANELALRLARAHTGRRDLVVLEAGYHGNTTTLTDISAYKFNGPGGEGAPPWVHVVPLPDVFRGRHRGPDAAAAYARHVRDLMDVGPRLAARGLCGFLAETCPSVGGQILLPEGYLDEVYRLVRAAGGLCIADEVQTAYGRMGTHFHAFQAHGVVPDIVVLGKPIGNGHPLGAVVTTAAIARSFDTGMEFFSTFGGSTVSCVAGLAVLDVVQQDDLQQHAARVGAKLLAGLREVASRHVVVGDVRGSGLFIGVELVRHRGTLEPAAAEAAYVVERFRQEGILIGTDGPFHNVLKIRPPMPFDDGDAARLAETMDRVLGELAERP